MTLVYVAGPYTRPDPCVNTHAALKAADRLWELGCTPYVPHLTHFWHTMSPRAYEEWMSQHLHFLPRCEALLRLPGESPGADREVARAKELGIPVYDSIEDLTRGLRP
jgi:hypothetical protein